MWEVKLLTNNVAKVFRDIILGVKVKQRTIYACPEVPIQIPGIGTGSAYQTGDCFGTQFAIKVPKQGRLNGAIFFDLDDEGLQTDLEIFSAPIVQVADNSAYAPTDAEILALITELQFFAFDDHGTSQTSEVKNFGKDYVCPSGEFRIQAVARGAQNIAAGNLPKVQLFILSDDPDWEG